MITVSKQASSNAITTSELFSNAYSHVQREKSAKSWFMTTNLYPLNQDIFEGFHFGAAEEEIVAEE
jgi:hypothetical protein